MSSNTKGRTTPRVVCCAIPIARSANKVLLITSRKRPNSWVCEYHPFLFRHAIFVVLVTHLTGFFACSCHLKLYLYLETTQLNSKLQTQTQNTNFPRSVVPKGGWESTDGVLEAAASREALEEGLTLYP